MAFTINATQPSGTEIRLSDSGKTNPEELAQVQKTLTELAAVEVVRVEIPRSRPLEFRAQRSWVGSMTKTFC